jgi:two-component system, OmpR family, sensor histidine kinase CreC
MKPAPRPPGRAVLFVHNLISAIAPPLHSLHWKIFLLCLAAVFLPGVYFAWKVGQGIERNQDLAVPTLLALALAALVSYALSTYLTRIITGLARQAERVADGEPGVRLETWTKSELGDLSRALEKMRRKLEGKAYVEEMALTLSHEIKTPLASIRGAAEILQQTGDEAVREKFLGNILGEVDRLASIVSNLLALSRIETAPADPGARTPLDETASQVAAIFRSRATSLGLDFETRISDRPCWVGIPADQLRRLMEALLENAFQFTPRGRKVSLETEPDLLRVRDEGPGIPEELREKIFDRFFTTVNPLTGRRGTGLGLAIVKSIAARHQAQISLESTPGSGTSVTAQFTHIS